MPKPLTTEQITALRAVPLTGTGMVNRLRIAIALAQVKQAEIVDETGIPAPNLSYLVNGKYGNLHVETAHKLAAFFGCQIEDLFPARDAVA
jgi:DNA-binding Xre family transcriptional regulator